MKSRLDSPRPNASRSHSLNPNSQTPSRSSRARRGASSRHSSERNSSGKNVPQIGRDDFEYSNRDFDGRESSTRNRANSRSGAMRSGTMRSGTMRSGEARRGIAREIDGRDVSDFSNDVSDNFAEDGFVAGQFARGAASDDDNVLDFHAARLDRLQRQHEQERFEARLESERTHASQIAKKTQERHELRLQREARLERQRAKAEENEQRFQAKLAKTPACHWGLFVTTILLALFSIPLVFSASTALALDHHGNADFFVLRQIGFVAVGLAWFVFVTRLNAKQMRIAVWALYAVAFIGLLAIDFTPLGTDLGSGTKRWLKIPGLPPQQVSELAKVALIGVMADFWSRASRATQAAKGGMMPWLAAGAFSLPFIGLVFLQPHLSAALLLAALPFVVAAHADVPRLHFVRILVPLALCGVVTIFMCKHHAVPFLKTYQQDRIANHFGSSDGKAKDDGNYQVEQSMRALVHGGVLGVGPGESLFKQGHLPAPHTDFIMAVIGEEWGLVGLLVLLLVYSAMIFFCLHVGHCAETSFEALLCSGVGTLLAIQVLGNAFVVTGIMPVTGIPLPLLSYGGSGLICTLTGIGMVLGISRRLGQNLGENRQNAIDASQKTANDDAQKTKRTTSEAVRRANATA